MTTTSPIEKARLKSQQGFSLMELLIALMIIGVIATLGIRGYSKYADRARHTKANDSIRIVAEGLDQYYIQNGKYPDMGSWEQMIAGNSPLVVKNMIPPNVPAADPWGQPFEGKAGKGTYELKCAGDPNDPEGTDGRGPIVREPGKITGGTGQAPAGKAGDKPAPAPGGGK